MGIETAGFLDALAGLGDAGTYSPAGGGAAVPVTGVFQIADEAAIDMERMSMVQRATAYAVRADQATPSRGGTLALTGVGSFTITSAPTWHDAGRTYWRCPVVPA